MSGGNLYYVVQWDTESCDSRSLPFYQAGSWDANQKQSKVTAAAGSMAEKLLGAGMTPENNSKYAVATGVVEYPYSRGPTSKQKRWVLWMQKKKKKQLEEGAQASGLSLAGSGSTFYEL